MNYRNAKFTAQPTVIDCEIEHPKFGWIPYTLDPADTDQTIDNVALLEAMRANADVAVYVAPTPPTEVEVLTAWRARAKLSRRDFCIALKRTGVLSAGQAVQAAKGDWPQAFAGALDQLPKDAQEEAEIEWAAVQEIRRNHPMIALLGSAANMTDEQVDALFGWTAS